VSCARFGGPLLVVFVFLRAPIGQCFVTDVVCWKWFVATGIVDFASLSIGIIGALLATWRAGRWRALRGRGALLGKPGPLNRDCDLREKAGKNLEKSSGTWLRLLEYNPRGAAPRHLAGAKSLR
jgi:hypothetical protein